MAQLSAFDIGQIKAHLYHGLRPADICKIMVKDDGKTHWSWNAINDAVERLAAQPKWKGERAKGSGRPRETTAKQDKAIEKHILKNRGKRKVTIKDIKRTFPELRKFGNTLVHDRIADVELEYLRRRKKSKVAKEFLEERVEYCHSVKRKHAKSLELWAYADGTTYYLDRTDAEFQESGMAALGPFVYRRTDRRDALYEDCLGPSSYHKGQGTPVRVWGMLACGRLHIEILDEGERWNTENYLELVEDKFEEWAGNCSYLVCDYERFLRTDLVVAAYDKANLELVDPYPRSSQDFNAIENCWKILKDFLDENMPTKRETRDEFVKRLRAAVSWANRCRKDHLWYLCTNQKQRADECLKTKPPGGRTSW